MEKLDKAFLKYPRRMFLPESLWGQSYLDEPLPIGFGQTNSQPTTVKLMLDWLEVESGLKVLDVGSGSGWTTALLSYLTGPKGRVIATEIIPELVEFGQNNCLKAGVKNVRFYLATEEFGKKEFGPYDRIMVSASADILPQELLEQLKVGGKMVIPVKSDVLEITKSEYDIDTIAHGGFIFVPLVSK